MTAAPTNAFSAYGKRLISARKMKRMSQDDLALAILTPLLVVEAWEAGLSIPRQKRADALAVCLGDPGLALITEYAAKPVPVQPKPAPRVWVIKAPEPVQEPEEVVESKHRGRLAMEVPLDTPGGIIRHARLGLKLDMLSFAVKVGVSKAYISLIELNHIKPSRKFLARVEAAYPGLVKIPETAVFKPKEKAPKKPKAEKPVIDNPHKHPRAWTPPAEGTFGRLLAEARRKANLSQREVCEKLGTSQPWYWGLEKNIRLPSAKLVDVMELVFPGAGLKEKLKSIPESRLAKAIAKAAGAEDKKAAKEAKRAAKAVAKEARRAEKAAAKEGKLVAKTTPAHRVYTKVSKEEAAEHIGRKSLPRVVPQKKVAPSTEEVLAAARAGNMEVFGDWCEANRKKLVGLAKHFLGSDHYCAEDMVQDSFVIASGKIVDFNNEFTNSLYAWVKQMMVYCCYERKRKDKREQGVDEDVLEMISTKVSVDKHENVGDAEQLSEEVDFLKSVFFNCLPTLPAKMREVARLRVIEGKHYADIAVITKIPVGTVMSTLGRARTKFKKALDLAKKKRLTAETGPTDEQLLARIADKDESALEMLEKRWRGPVKNIAFKFVHDYQKSEDVCQDVFLKIWKNAVFFTAIKGKPSSWIFSIATNTAKDSCRFDRSRGNGVTTSYPAEILVRIGHAISASVGIQERLILEKSILELPEKSREVINLFYMEGLSHPEIAERVKTPLGTIKTRIRTSLLKLKVLMNSQTKAA